MDFMDEELSTIFHTFMEDVANSGFQGPVDTLVKVLKKMVVI